jgi:hypothetical protein
LEQARRNVTDRGMASTDGKIADAYHLARALLTDRGPDDHGVTSEATERPVARADDRGAQQGDARSG